MNGRIVFGSFAMLFLLYCQSLVPGDFPVRAQTAKPVPSQKELAFLQGTWSGASEKGSYVEEYWSPPVGDTMIGHCRFITEGKTTFYELLAIVWEPSRVVLKMRHFNKDFIGWDESAEAGDCVLIRCTASELLFENSRSEHKVRVLYQKVDHRDDAIQTFVEDTKDGQTHTYPFKYQRI